MMAGHLQLSWTQLEGEGTILLTVCYFCYQHQQHLSMSWMSEKEQPSLAHHHQKQQLIYQGQQGMKIEKTT